MIGRMHNLWRGIVSLLAMLLLLASPGVHAQTGLTPESPSPTLVAPPDPGTDYNDAAFVSQSVPTSMVAGSTYNCR